MGHPTEEHVLRVRDALPRIKELMEARDSINDVHVEVGERDWGYIEVVAHFTRRGTPLRGAFKVKLSRQKHPRLYVVDPDLYYSRESETCYLKQDGTGENFLKAVAKQLTHPAFTRVLTPST